MLSTATCFHVHKGINIHISIGNKAIFRRREQEVFFTEPEKGPLCGCACLERTPQPLACHGRNPQLQLPRSITEQYYWLFGTRPLDTNHPEHAGARDTGKALLCPPSIGGEHPRQRKSHENPRPPWDTARARVFSRSLSFCFILRGFHNWRSLISSSLLNRG
jgi:hypothetical protein